MTQEKIKELLLEEASNKKISCPRAREIAKEVGVKAETIGKLCNQLKIKIYACELGCFK